MKLITKTNRNFMVVLTIVLPVSCILLFLSLNYFLTDEVDELLKLDERRIVEQLKDKPVSFSIAPTIEVKEIEKEIVVNEKVKEVLVYDPIGKEEEPFRELESVKQINGKWYLIKVRHSTIEKEDFFMAIGLTMGSMLILIFVLLFFLNNRQSLKLWQPFYFNIDKLKTYSIKESKELVLLDSKIEEFQALKNSLISLTNKLQKDYKLLKEFTENASHEIQTPLSVISMNLEEIMQEDHSEAGYKKLYSCYRSTQRLSKLNGKLLLLAKLDNDQFSDLKEVNINVILNEKIVELGPLLEEQGLEVKVVDKQHFITLIDPVLANILMINLLSNAIKHSVPNSIIRVFISDISFSISNDTNSIMDHQLIFERFKKGSDSENSTGLGLSIVKSITEVSNLKVEASYEDDIFTISIKKL